MTNNNRSFKLFLTSQVTSSLAASFHFIAVAALLIKLTGSGTSASFAVVCTPITSFLLSPFAGSIGDRFNEKYILAILEFLKVIIAIIFIQSQNIMTIYLLMLLIAAIEILCGPPKKKIITKLLKAEDIMTGNSILTGITGFTFILGPILSGIIIDKLNINIIFQINIILYLLSSLILLFVKNKTYKSKLYGKEIKVSMYDDIKKGFEYFKSNSNLKEIVIISTIVNIAIASINVAFYPFAFDILNVDSKTWGIMMSVFYGTNLITMFISISLKKIVNKLQTLIIYSILVSLAIVWILYSLSNSLSIVLLLQFIEGSLISFITIIINTRLQVTANRQFIARVSGINDVFNNIGKLTAIVCTYGILSFYSARVVFILNFAIIFTYVNYKIFVSRKN
ncbi:major facilitator transporter [Gottschalkia acidurici 9a]|uniref:Major facilitator transporter n=1 Tax=Gottschalkia acidurici (strain ATCC 7906 / DSM 604 / BCRC 14475 / CIP 104303 / KCTC 5404 / NCIMB 10678 / 9a) TaxID=1128398 RepID=K0AYB5_GOTA9|nr:MFS transporter [Gottschalkia acidurici]AFS78773.1 major facilitator transporter [Gottschalkia acidurici 9a]